MLPQRSARPDPLTHISRHDLSLIHPALRPTPYTVGCDLTVTSDDKQILRTHQVEKRHSSFFKRRSVLSEDARRDSGLAPSLSTMGNDVPLDYDERSAASNRLQHDIPSIVIQDDVDTSISKLNMKDDEEIEDEDEEYEKRPTSSRMSTPVKEPPTQDTAARVEQSFSGIATAIPTGDLDDPFSSDDLTFSKRGSVLWGGQKTNAILPCGRSRPGSQSVRSMLEYSQAEDRHDVSDRVVSHDESKLSKKVRSMYEHGDENALPEWLARCTSATADDDFSAQPANERSIGTETPPTQTGLQPSSTSLSSRPSSALASQRGSVIRKQPWEIAGGIEDWKDVQSEDVDRYGFIKPKHLSSRGDQGASSSTPGSPESHRSRRGANGLSTVDESGNISPTLARGGSSAKRNKRVSIAPSATAGLKDSPTKNRTPSVLSKKSNRSRRSSLTFKPFRSSSDANFGRRWADEAVDMLVQEPGASVLPMSISESLSPAKAAVERRREGKWEEMAKAAKTTSMPSKHSSYGVGAGTSYAFDTRDPKLISRTWKGIPDRWRGPAWYSFLTTSARQQQGASFVPDATVVESFHELQHHDCVDDVQIDMDVPRTIGGHVMFRRRYRGGQRLLFRVLRALTLYFPETGYVQGMATIAATLLCYYDEERAFVMMVRMWQCRGLQELYRPGFSGLMSTLERFEQGGWLGAVGNGRVQKALDEHGVSASAYGTKWYLTLFAYSLPFTAQLRVWDVFMLLGGERTGKAPAKASKKASQAEPDFDILHAVAAGLLDGLQDVIADAEFESVMKVLTSPVPVGREDIMMRMARKEWKQRRGKM